MSLCPLLIHHRERAGKEKSFAPKEREKAEREEERPVLNKLSHERKEEEEEGPKVFYSREAFRDAFPILKRKTARTFISERAKYRS